MSKDIDEEHAYANMEITLASNKRDFVDSAPNTPSKLHAGNKIKSKTAETITEVSNAAILEAINSLGTRADGQLEELSIQMKQNSTIIANMAKAVEFNSAEVKGCGV